jgi:CPA2 family monovalent cation:H+ antiporter-2
VVIGSAAAVRLIDPAFGDLLVVVIALTMAATPLLAAIGQRLDRRLEVHHVNTTQHVEEETSDLKDHALVAGFGRVGQSVSRMLHAASQPYVAFELDASRVAAARRQGLPVFYGDASRIEVLRAAGGERARTAIIILDNAAAAENTVSVLHHNFPSVKTFVRARDHRHRRRLEAAGATNVVHETYELSLQLGERALRGMGVPEALAEEIVARHRADDYALLSDIIFPDPTLVEDDEGKRPQPATKAPTGR